MKDQIEFIVLKSAGYDSDYNSIYQQITKWNRGTKKDLDKLRAAISDANQLERKRNKYNAEMYYVVTKLENYQEIFDSAAEWREQIESEVKKEAARVQNEKKKREKAALERKKKQLEKLKKELGE